MIEHTDTIRRSRFLYSPIIRAKLEHIVMASSTIASRWANARHKKQIWIAPGPVHQPTDWEFQMLKKSILATAAVLALSVSAYASQCPTDMAKIDAAIETAQLSDTDKAAVMDLRTRGEAAHEAGNHDESVQLLSEAKAMLKVE